MGKLIRRAFPLLICILVLPVVALAGTSDKLDTSLLPLTDSSDTVHVFVFLHDQPLWQVSQDVQSARMPQIRVMEEELRSISLRQRTRSTFAGRDDEAAAARLEMSTLTPADRKLMREMNNRLSTALDELKNEIGSRMRAAVDADQRKLSEQITTMGGRVVYRYDIVNALAVFAPGRALRAIADLPLVVQIAPVGHGEGALDISVPSIAASTFYNAGETGGAFRPAICDTGVDTSHPALSGHSWVSGVFHTAAVSDGSYDDSSASTDDLQSHGSHVAGIALSSDATYRGVAYGSAYGMNLKAGYRTVGGGNRMWWSDMAQAVDWGLNSSGSPPVAINFSFGDSGNLSLDDSSCAKFWDAVVDGELTSAAICAGNSGSSDRTIWDPAEAYNAICVANISDAGTVSRTDDVISSSSSRGPVGTGRKKPDLAAPGSSIMSISNTWEGTASDFRSMSGTSMATPHVVGALTLLADAGVTDPRAAKALLINTAQDKGAAGWDNAYGWGYIDLDHVYFHRADVFQSSIYPNGVAGIHYRLYRVIGMSSGEKCTLVWNRSVPYTGGFPSTSYALSNLDLSLYLESDSTLIAASTSTLDNVEQVQADRTGVFIVKVATPSATFSHTGSESFALATEEGASEVSGPVLVAQPEATVYTPAVNTNFQVRVRVTNSGDMDAPSCSVTLGQLPQGLTLISGAITQSVGNAARAGSSQWAAWTLQAMPVGSKTVDFSCAGAAFGIPSAGSGQIRVDVPDLSGTIKINSNASTTSDRNVTLQLTATPPIVQMRLRNEIATWSGWEAFAPTRAWRLTAGNADKAVYVQFRDAGGNLSPVAVDSIYYTGDATVGSIGEAKTLQDDTYVTLTGKVVTARLSQSNACCIEEMDRSSGILISTIASGLQPSKSTDVSGILATSNGKRILTFAEATHITSGSAVRPLMLSVRAVGGTDFAYLPGLPKSGQKGVLGGSDLNNVGLLIRVRGRIFSDPSGHLRVDDGSKPVGLTVDTFYLTASPAAGAYVTITGISSLAPSGDGFDPVIIPRDNSDVVPL